MRHTLFHRNAKVLASFPHGDLTGNRLDVRSMRNHYDCGCSVLVPVSFYLESGKMVCGQLPVVR